MLDDTLIELPFPDEPLTFTTYSLTQFVKQAEDLKDNGNRFVDFVLAGRCGDPGNLEGPDCRRIFVNPVLDGVRFTREVQREHMVVTRDYDSFIGRTKDLPFTQTFTITPIAPFSDTLKLSNHVKGLAFDGDGATIWVDMHKIPNIGFGSVAKRHLTRLFFPRLYRHHGTMLDSSWLKQIYDDYVRPALQDLETTSGHRFPATYDIGLQHIRDLRGRYHFPTFDIPSYHLETFVKNLRRRFREQPNLRDTYFVHELRGTKAATTHNPYDRDQIEEALNDYLEFLDMTRIDTDNWVIDIGLEVHYDGHIVQWLRSSHTRLLQYALPSQPENILAAIAQGERGKHFFLDRAAQLNDLAGFRLDPHTYGDLDGVEYINVYTTDKSVTYQLHDGLWRRRDCRDLSHGREINKLVEELDKMSAVLRTVSRDPTMDSNARLEIRMTLTKAMDEDTHSYLSSRLIKNSVIAFPAWIWWQFKFYRLMAYHAVVNDLANAGPESRRWPASLTVGAMIIYMINGLSYREAQSEDWDELLSACSMHIKEADWDDDEDYVATEAIGHHRGLWFLSSISLEQTARIHPRRLPSRETLARLYYKNTFDDLDHEFGHTAILQNRNGPRVDARRIPNRRTGPKPAQFYEEDLQDEHMVTDLEAKGITIRVSEPMEGEDLEDWEALPGDDNGTQSPNIRFAMILKHFPVDILACCANRQDRRLPSYMLLPMEEIQNTTLQRYKSFDLSDIFGRVQVRVCNSQTWSLMFDRYFPRRSAQPINRGDVQNFPYTYYYSRWIRLMNEVENSAQATFVREEVRKDFNQLRWVPHADSDRMWCTRQPTGAIWTMVPNDGVRCPCPHIAVNAVYGGVRDIQVAIEENHRLAAPMVRTRRHINGLDEGNVEQEPIDIEAGFVLPENRYAALREEEEESD